ncbi:mucin-12 [Trichomycterus rosablanca]|uniref:mucin-12 n=1 Tax=Trichomycterus rosablanca TaxID=2290929 RepID=UPI002F3542F1
MRESINFSDLHLFCKLFCRDEVNTDCGGTIDAYQQRTGSIRYSTKINSLFKRYPAVCTWIIDARVNQTVWIEVLDLDNDAQVRIQFENNSVILKDHDEQDEHVSFSSTGKTTVEWSWEDDVELPRELHLRFNTSEGGPDSPHVPYTHSDSDPVSPSLDGAVGVTRVPDVSGFRSAPLSAGVRQGGGEAGSDDKYGSLFPQEAAHNGQEKPGEAIPDLVYAVGRSHRHTHTVSSSEKKPRAELSGRTMGAYLSEDVRAEFVTQESQPATKQIDSQEHNGIRRLVGSAPVVNDTPTDATVSAGSRKSSHEAFKTVAVTYRGGVPVMSQASMTNGGRNRPDPGTLGTTSEDKSFEIERRPGATHADQNVSPQTHSPVYRGGTTTMPSTHTASGGRNQLHLKTLGTTHETSRPVPVFRNDGTAMSAASAPGTAQTATDATVSASSRKSSHEALKTIAVTYRGGVPVMSPASTPNGGRIWPGLNTLANTRSETDAGRANRSPRSTQMNQGVSFKPNQTDLPIFNLSDVSNQTRSAFYDDSDASNSTDGSPLSTVIQDVSNQTHVSVLEESDPVSSSPPAASHDQTNTSRPVLSDHDTARSLEDFDHSTATSTKETDSPELYRSTSLPSTTNQPSFTKTFDPTTAHVSPTSASTLPTESYLATLSSRSPNTDDASATTLQSSSTYPIIATTTISTVTSGFSPRVPITTEALYDDHSTTVLRADYPLTTSVPPGTASTEAVDIVPDHRSWTFGTDLLTPSPPDTHSSSPTLESTRSISTAQDDSSTTKLSHSTGQPTTTTTWSGSTETANQNTHRLTTSVQTHILSEPPTRTTQPMQTSEGSSSSKPGTQTSLMSVSKRPLIHPGTARNDKDWAHNVRVFVLEDQPAIANVETFQVLLQVILEDNSPSYEGLVEIEPFLQRIEGYQSQHVTWHSGPAFQSVVTFGTAEAVSWLGRAESLLQKAGLRPLPAEGIFVGGVRVKNVTVGGLHGDVCAWLFSCPFGFQCVSSEGNASCRSVCHSGYCKHQGICVHRAGQPPVCQCPVGEDFWFMGQRCDLRMTRQRLAGVCFGVLAAVAVLMAVLAYLAVRRFKTMLAQAKADQTQSSYRRFNHFDELSARFWQRSWPGSDDSLDNVAFSRSDELLHMRALDRPCCYHDDTLSIASTYPGSASHVKTVYPHSSQYQWDMSTCSLADCVIDSGKASDLSVCSWPIEPIQWTPFPLLQQLNQNTTTTKSSRSRSYCEGMELVDMEKSRTA